MRHMVKHFVPAVDKTKGKKKAFFSDTHELRQKDSYVYFKSKTDFSQVYLTVTACPNKSFPNICEEHKFIGD